jgi:hypothetical protein
MSSDDSHSPFQTSSNIDLLKNPKKQEILRKALIGVCKDIDYAMKELGEESNSADRMKKRLNENPQEVFGEISQDEEVMKLINEWIKDEEKTQ